MGIASLERMRVLIGDPVRLTYLPSQSSAVQVESEGEILERLQESRFDLIVISENIGTLAVVPLMKNLLRNHPGVPVFFLYERYGDENFDSEDLRLMGARGRLPRPDSYPALFLALKEKIFELISCNPENPPATLPKAHELQEISLDAMRKGFPTLFELYSIDPQGDVQFLVRKGEVLRDLDLQKIYIRKDELDRYLALCDAVLGKMMKRTSTTLEDRLLLVEEYGARTLNALHAMGAQPALIEHASQFSKHMFKLLDTSEFCDLKEVKQMLLSKKEMEHSVQISMIAGILANRMRLTSDKTKWIVGSAALLHDIGIFSLPNALQKKAEEAMTKEEFAIYAQHPLLAVDILAEAPNVDDAILQAVAQHHERKDGKGYPKRLGIGGIHRMAEIIGMAEEFVHKMVMPDRPVPLEQFLAYASNRFSDPVVEALASSFGAKK